MKRLSLTLVVIAFFVGVLLFAPAAFQVGLQALGLGLMLLVWGLFSVSLHGARTPMITRYALLIDTDLTEAEKRYTRQVTWLWWWVLSALLAFKVWVLTLPPYWATELIMFAVLAGLFVGEFYWRKGRFKQRNHGSFIAFIRRLSRIPLQQVLGYEHQRK